MQKSTASRPRAAHGQRAGADGRRRPGVDDPGLIERSIASGVSAYLTKTLNSLELRRP